MQLCVNCVYQYNINNLLRVIIIIIENMIIIIIIEFFQEFFIPVLADGFSPELRW